MGASRSVFVMNQFFLKVLFQHKTPLKIIKNKEIVVKIPIKRSFGYFFFPLLKGLQIL